MDINFENRFWQKTLSDHLDFIHDKLFSNEINLLETTNSLKGGLVNSPKTLPETLTVVKSIKDLKINILYGLLSNTVKINLNPTFINHMLNEIEEYITILSSAIEGKVVTPSPVHLHLVWLPDAVGHSVAVSCDLDPIEKLDIKKFKKYKKKFHILHVKALEFKGYLRAAIIDDSPMMSQLNNDVSLIMSRFITHLSELSGQREESTKLGIITPQLLNHMIREELYYLTKLGLKVMDPNEI